MSVIVVSALATNFNTAPFKTDQPGAGDTRSPDTGLIAGSWDDSYSLIHLLWRVTDSLTFSLM